MITITFARPGHDAAIATLIVGIQRDEFGFDVSLADQPDLADIPGFYRAGAGNFWVALDGDAVVGTIALKDIGEVDDHRSGALRKMFVAASHRGREHGIAHALVATLLAWCEAHGIDTLWLGTTERFAAAHRFYDKQGFDRVDPATLPATFPRMALDTRFYRRSTR